MFFWSIVVHIVSYQRMLPDRKGQIFFSWVSVKDCIKDGLKTLMSSPVLAPSSWETTINEYHLGILAATCSCSSRQKSGCLLIQYILVVPFYYVTGEKSDRMETPVKENISRWTEEPMVSRCMLFIHIALVDCNRIKGGMWYIVFIFLKHTLPRLLSLVFPQFFFFM